MLIRRRDATADHTPLAAEAGYTLLELLVVLLVVTMMVALLIWLKAAA